MAAYHSTSPSSSARRPAQRGASRSCQDLGASSAFTRRVLYAMTYSCEKIAAHRPSGSTAPGGKPTAVCAERYCATRFSRISAATSNTLNATTSQVERPSAASARIWLRTRSLVARTKLISRNGLRSRKGLSSASASDTFIDVYQTTSPSRFASSSLSAAAWALIARQTIARLARMPHIMLEPREPFLADQARFLGAERGSARIALAPAEGLAGVDDQLGMRGVSALARLRRDARIERGAPG